MKDTNLKSNKTAAGRLFNQGYVTAKKDIKEGWVTASSLLADEDSTRGHLNMSTGAGKSFCDGYLAAAKDVSQANMAKGNAETFAWSQINKALMATGHSPARIADILSALRKF